MGKYMSFFRTQRQLKYSEKRKLSTTKIKFLTYVTCSFFFPFVFLLINWLSYRFNNNFSYFDILLFSRKIIAFCKKKLFRIALTRTPHMQNPTPFQHTLQKGYNFLSTNYCRVSFQNNISEFNFDLHIFKQDKRNHQFVILNKFDPRLLSNRHVAL